MAIFSSPAGFLEILVFLCAVAAFVVAVRFFVVSRRGLNEAFPEITGTHRPFSFGFDSSGFLVPKRPGGLTVTPAYTGSSSSSTLPDKTKEELKELRQQLRQQQQELSKVLQRLGASGGNEAAPARTTGPVDTSKEWQNLQARLTAKEAEVQQLRHHEAYAQKLEEQFEEVQLAFEDIQEKMLQMERSAWQTAELNMQLEQAAEARHLLEKALHQKDEKLQLLSLENSQLREALHEMETKLSEANLHHQQLLRKMDLLEGLNTDFRQMADAARRLKTGMARAAELESMLQLMTGTEQTNKE